MPRNLTANADYVVTGNPSISRPESGVGNTWPGLEYDDCTLERRFFPGLYFEFHRGEGAILTQVYEGSDPNIKGLTNEDLPLYLWGYIGKRDPQEENVSFFSFDSFDGQEVWNHLHNLSPGQIVLILGPEPGISSSQFFNAELRSFVNQGIGTGGRRYYAKMVMLER